MMRQRILRAIKKSAKIWFVLIVGGAGYYFIRAPQFLEDPVLSSAMVMGLALVGFLTYFTLSLVGYKVREDGDIDVPRPLAWLLVGVLVGGFIGVTLYFSLRSS